MSSQTGSPRQAEPSPRASFPKLPPEKRLERRRMSFRAASSAPAQDIAAGLPPMPPPLPRSDRTERQRARLPVFRARQAPAGPATRQTTRQTDGAAGLAPRRISAAGRFFPHASAKARERLSLHPLMNDEGRRMTPSPFCAARRFFPACVGLTVSADNPSAPFSPAPR